jgi:antitoxin (DNA-binding transcriptional repressor) of toxin-antitoxin stability system
MAVTQVEVHELPTRFGELVALAAAGTEVLLTEGHVPRARLVPLAPPRRIAGLHRGAIQTTEDFDTPLPEDFWAGQS